MIVVLGDLMVDVVATASTPLARGSDASATVRTHGGGSAANVAAWLGELGAEVALVCRVGDDAAGAAQVAALREAGVDVRAQVDPSAPTGTCVVLVEPGGERTFLPDRAANRALRAEPLGLRAGDHLHVSGYALHEPGAARGAALAALAEAAAVGATTSVDPASAAPLRATGAAGFLELVAGVGLLVPNADEAAVLTGQDDPSAAARRLGAGREAVVTCGAQGAVWSNGHDVGHGLAEHVVAADSTGAGDAWAAGWLHARLGAADVPTALAAAAALGARAARTAGARPA